MIVKQQHLPVPVSGRQLKYIPLTGCLITKEGVAISGKTFHVEPEAGHYIAVRVNDEWPADYALSTTLSPRAISVESRGEPLYEIPVDRYLGGAVHLFEWPGAETPDLLDVLRQVSDWDQVPLADLHPRDVYLVNQWRRGALTPAEAVECLVRSRRRARFTRRLRWAFRAVVGEQEWDQAVRKFDLGRLHVLADQLLWEGEELSGETAMIRFARLWLLLAEPGRPIGSSYNPPPETLAGAARNRAFDRLRPWEIRVVLPRLSRWQARWARLSRLRAAARAWRVASNLPWALAHRVGRMSRRGRLAARAAWARVELEPEECREERFWEVLRGFLTAPAYRWARELHSPHLAAEAMFPQLPWALRDELASAAYQAARGRLEDPATQAAETLGRISLRAYLALREQFEEHDRQYAFVLAAVFGRRAPEYLRRAGQRGLKPHDAACLVPPVAAFERDTYRGLGDWLLSHVHHEKPEILGRVATAWGSAIKAAGRLAPETDALVILALVAKTANGSGGIAEPLMMEFLRVSGSPPSPETEWRWLVSLGLPPAFPTDKRWEAGELTGRFLPREDPRGIVLGWHTNCCQRIGAVGESCAWHGQANPLGGFFVVEDHRGSILAQSWAWWRPGEGLCFDNVEARGLSGREDLVAAIYQAAARDLAQAGYGRVTVGEGNSDLDVARWPIATPPLTPPGGVYTDARRQRIMAEGKAARKAPDDEYYVVVSRGEAVKAFGLERVAAACYPEGWQFVDYDDCDLFLVLLHRGQAIGYAGLEVGERYVNDVAVLPEHRGRGSLVLILALLRVMRGIAPAATWTGDCRDSTSYRLIQVAARRGRLRLVDERPNGDMNGELMYRVAFAF